MLKQKTYANGLKLVVNSIDCLKSVSVGILVGAGSCKETDAENGISHFIEHVNFKGTKRRDSFQISDEIDGLGAQMNAFTAKDVTCYYVKCTDEHIEDCFDVLTDVFLNPVYPPEELDKERGVILEEISMTEDTPDDLCLDVLEKAFYGNEGYGKTILGTEENVSRFSAADVYDYRAKYYVPENTVISFAGNISFEKADELCNKYLGGYKGEKTFEAKTPSIICRRGNGAVSKNIEQAHIAFAMPSVCIESPDKSAALCINSILGGGMSSRLFQKVREKSGLAYSVYSYLSSYKETGLLTVYAGVNPSKIQTAFNALMDETSKLATDGVTEKELKRAKEQIKGSTVLSQESTSSLMMSYGKRMLLTGKLFDVDKELASLSQLKLDYVNETCAKYFTPDVIATAIIAENAVPLMGGDTIKN